ncbi:uncharacterized protein SETTUDRAFT_168022 [Exserohilum turcica Et28A]|uniref:Uncharacterized protein n=1 Tax=Exserohilum turcicum (strain 28A) TaxID=671987 RepID=R0KLD1_EXST2|nr:uncharacterized protein SETTUDRAFT_168022 [Exserohilum turcica Et28A]EOA88772.1 hypothetical protein SETTUDRAFT_168022 [Exserohilum turcica Et28A]
MLLSLVGIVSAQTSTWGEPFTVEASNLPATSTEVALPSALIPQATTSTWGQPFTVEVSESAPGTTRTAVLSISTPQASTSSWGEPFTVDNSATFTSVVTSNTGTESLAVDTVTPTPLVSNSTVVSVKTSSASSTASTSSTTTESESPTGSESSTGTSRPSTVPGAAAPLGSVHKMTVAGVVVCAVAIIFA